MKKLNVAFVAIFLSGFLGLLPASEKEKINQSKMFSRFEKSEGSSIPLGLIKLEKSNQPGFNLVSDVFIKSAFRLESDIHKIIVPIGPQHIRDEVSNIPIEKQKYPAVDALLKYVRSEESQKCENAVNNVIYHNEFSYFEEPQILLNFGSYKENCGLFTLSTYDDKKVEKIKERLVVLIDEDEGEVICSGFLLSKTIIVTARHCFYYNKKTSDNIKLEINNKTKTTIYDSDYRVVDSACGEIYKNVSNPYDKSMQACDYVFLKIDGAIHGLEIEEFPVEKAVNAYDKLLVLGYHKFNHRYESKINNAPYHWSHGLVVADNPMCIAFHATPNLVNNSTSFCFSHGCQTIVGMSGAPVFTQKENKIFFTGIQIGPTTFDAAAWSVTSNRCLLRTASNQEAFRNNVAITTPNPYEEHL